MTRKNVVFSDLMVVRSDQAVDLIIRRCVRISRVAVSGQSSTSVPITCQALLIQVDMDRHTQLENIKKMQL